MMISDDVRRLLVLCAIRVDGKSPDWSLLARSADSEGVDDLYAGHVAESSPTATKSRQLLRVALQDPEILDGAAARVEHELEVAQQHNARLTTVLDDDFPLNLRAVPDRPPFLFVQGALTDADLTAVAVVGTRQVTDTGRARAERMARELVRGGCTIASGLARGVDTAAHEAALAAGGRTVAVIGTGVSRCYPAENRGLAERIVQRGAVVSQFWPTRTPGRDTFPRRNRVTSGISQGTVVIEASSTSGAKMQARLAAQHGKHVWLIQSLLDSQEWARGMAADGRAKVISSSTEIIAELRPAADVLAARGEPSKPAYSDQQLMIEL